MKSIFIFLFFPLILLAQNQPSQALSGPGGTDYSHAGVTEYFKDSASLSYWIFQPNQPQPDSADLVIFNHGYGQINPMVHAEWITHLVRKGNIVVYPKYQDDLNTPTDSFLYNTAEAIKMAIAEMQQTGYVIPNLDHFAMIGHSYGGAISANLTYLHHNYGLPQVKALMVAQGYYGADMLLPSYANFPYNTKMQLVVGDNDGTVGNDFARLLMDSANVDPLYKNYITHYADNYGSPAVTARHEDPICISPNQDYDSGESNFWVLGAQFFNKLDVVDYYCYWKLSEALLDCTFYGTNCEYAFGDTPEQRFMGAWSDSTAIVELVVEPQAPNAIPQIEKNIETLIAVPNPTTGSIQLVLEEVLQGAKLQLYSSVGQLLWQREAAILETGYSIELPKAAGCYYLMVQDGKKIYQSNLVKMD